MWLDLREVALAPDRRPVTPADLTAKASIAVAEAEAMADEVRDWWAANFRDLWPSTWVARLPGWGHQYLRLPRFPCWADPPVVIPMSNEVAGSAYDATGYRVAGNCRQFLYREAGWPWTAPVTAGVSEYPAPGLEQPSLRVGPDDSAILGFRAGYVMPGELATWAAPTTWAVGASASYDSGTSYGWARATDRTVKGLFEVTAGSGAESSEPTWPTVDGDSVVGSNATFTLRLHAKELPRIFVTASLRLARALNKAAKGGNDCDGKEAAAVLGMVRRAC